MNCKKCEHQLMKIEIASGYCFMCKTKIISKVLYPELEIKNCDRFCAYSHDENEDDDLCMYCSKSKKTHIKQI